MENKRRKKEKEKEKNKIKEGSRAYKVKELVKLLLDFRERRRKS